MKENDMKFLRLAIDAANKARQNGKHPFGAVLVDAQGSILLTGENTVITEKACMIWLGRVEGMRSICRAGISSPGAINRLKSLAPSLKKTPKLCMLGFGKKKNYQLLATGYKIPEAKRNP